MCLDGGMDIGSDSGFEGGTELDTGFDSGSDLDVSAIDTSDGVFESSVEDISDCSFDFIDESDATDVNSVEFDVEPLDDNNSEYSTEDFGELVEELDDIEENFEKTVDLSPIEEPYMNQEFDDSCEMISDSVIQSEVPVDTIDEQSFSLDDNNEETSENLDVESNVESSDDVSDSEIIEPSDEWIPDDFSFENGNGELTEIKMDADFLEEKYAEAIESGNQDMADRYRALHDIVSISKDLELTDGDPKTTQLGGLHKDVQGQIDGFESHHIPAQSVQDVNPRDLPTIALSKEDHAQTDSYRWKSNREYEPFLPDGLDDHPTYKQEAEEMIDSGKYTDLVRDELYNIRDATGHKYDGAIKQYLNELSNMIAKDGIPKSK